MIGTSTSQLQFTGIDAFTAGIATALMTAQPALATTLVSFSETALPPGKAISQDGRTWVSAHLQKIGDLSTNWDGYGADPIHPAVIRSMKANLEQLLQATSAPGSIVPGGDGSLQAEWHLERASFGLLVEIDGMISCWVRPLGLPEIERFGVEGRELFQSAVLTYLS